MLVKFIYKDGYIDYHNVDCDNRGTLPTIFNVPKRVKQEVIYRDDIVPKNEPFLEIHKFEKVEYENGFIEYIEK